MIKNNYDSLMNEIKENPEKLKDFLESFDKETVVQTLLDVLKDYVLEDEDNRSIFVLLETPEHIRGVMLGRKVNLVNAAINSMLEQPEIREMLETATEFLNTNHNTTLS